MLYKKEFREGIVIILVNHRKNVFWIKRAEQNVWQFPQGSIYFGETPEQAMYRNLEEKTGLKSGDIEIIACSNKWLHYRFPRQMIRYHSNPIWIGQRHKWFLLRLVGNDSTSCFNHSDSREFPDYRWVKYWYPLRRVIAFKRCVYRSALQEFAPLLFERNSAENSVENGALF